jgi:hypothetical protein
LTVPEPAQEPWLPVSVKVKEPEQLESIVTVTSDWFLGPEIFAAFGGVLTIDQLIPDVTLLGAE